MCISDDPVTRPWHKHEEVISISIYYVLIGTTLEQVETFKYLGQTITSDGRSDTAIRQRIEIARQTFLNMSDVLTARNIEIETRKRLVRCYVLSTLLYASETWTLNADTSKKTNSFEMWMYRKMLTISYRSHTTNEEVLKRVNEKGLSLEKNIKMRKAQFFGHLVRKDKMQKSLLEGKTCAKRPRGRPRKSWMKNIMELTKLNFEQCIRGAEDRDYWRGVMMDLLNWSSHRMMMMMMLCAYSICIQLLPQSH